MSRFLAVALLACWAQEKSAPARDWVLIYYMSYDNNLERCGPIILDGLEKGVKDSNLVVTVLHDDTDKAGLKRHVLTSEGRATETLATDNSASEEVLKEYLAWAAKTYPAKHYAVVFLDHGGRLDEMCVDAWPGEKETKRWLSAKLTGPVLRQFRKEAPGAVDLLFLQQCGRGSIENLFNFRGAASAILASQTTVGAPNTYYAKSAAWLASNPKATGAELAKQIMGVDEHFMNYVCVDGKAVEELPARLEPVVKALLEGGVPKAPSKPKPCFNVEDERNYDLLEWLEGAFRDNGRAVKPLDDFKTWVTAKLVLSHVKHAKAGKRAETWTGLSIFVPSEKIRSRYAGYPIYEESLLDELWK
jgi:hypothetical protein